MREYREVLSGGRLRANLGQLRRSLSQAEIYLEGVRGPARVAEIRGKGEIGVWLGQERGKQRNRKRDDGTGQGYQSGKEKRLGLGTSVVMGILTERHDFMMEIDNMVITRKVGFPRRWEVNIPR